MQPTLYLVEVWKCADKSTRSVLIAIFHTRESALHFADPGRFGYTYVVRDRILNTIDIFQGAA